MSCRGVHFAITTDDLIQLRCGGSDDGVLAVVQAIEERWEKDAGFVCETDKAWDAIHRCLTDGTLKFRGGSEPLRLCILGGEKIYHGDDYIISLVRHDQLRLLADALASVTPQFIGEHYWTMPDEYGQKSNEDCQYTWDWFSDLPAFFDRAEKAGRHVIFTADQ